MVDRFKRTGDAIAAGLRCAGAACEPGHLSLTETAAGMATILRARLGPNEGRWLAVSALLALNPDNRRAVISAHTADDTGNPPAIAFLNVMREAEDWARFASTDERRAYMGAIWRALPQNERRGFLDSIGLNTWSAA